MTVEIRSDLAVLNPLVAIPAEHDVARLERIAGRAVAANRRHAHPPADAGQGKSEIFSFRGMRGEDGNDIEQQDAEAYTGSKHWQSGWRHRLLQ